LRLRALGKLAGAEQDVRLRLGDLEGQVVLVVDPTLELDVVLHPTVELERMGADDLRVDPARLQVLHEGRRHRLKVLVAVTGPVRVLARGDRAGDGLGRANALDEPEVVPELVGEPWRLTAV